MEKSTEGLPLLRGYYLIREVWPTGVHFFLASLRNDPCVMKVVTGGAMFKSENIFKYLHQFVCNFSRLQIDMKYIFQIPCVATRLHI